MKTRRGFLQAGSLAAAAHLSNLSLSSAPSADSAPAPAAMRDYWNDFPNYLTSIIAEARTRRTGELARIKTADDAARRAAFTRTKVWDLIGGPLEKSPLNVAITGALERDGYRIEKLV